MAGTDIMVGIYTSTYQSPYPIEKVGDSPYPVNAGILRQNGDELSTGASLFVTLFLLT